MHSQGYDVIFNKVYREKMKDSMLSIL